MKILEYIEKGKKEGATLLCGGNRVGDKGYFIEPTIFGDVKDDMTIAKEEIFGPVLCILKYKTIDEVIDRANDSKYGLGAGIVGKDIGNIHKVVNGLRVGSVYVNCFDETDTNTPFGGYKDSGVGRELGIKGLNAYLETKTTIIKIPDNSLLI